MKILIITAHPSSQGFTHQVAARYTKGATESGHEVEILDLYKTDLKQGFVQFEDKRDWSNGAEVRAKMQAKISWADEIVIAHPLWWGGPPAILKNFLDQNLTPHFAYQNIKRPYLPDALNIKPLGLLTPRSARVFATCDGPGWLYFCLAYPFLTIWRLIVLGYCGLQVKSTTLFHTMRLRPDEQKEAWLVKVERMGRTTR